MAMPGMLESSPMRKLMALAALLAGCGDDGGGGPVAPEAAFCERFQTCPGIVAYKTQAECERTMKSDFDAAPKSCGDCMAGLTCAGLEQGLSDKTGATFSRFCPSCP